MSNPHGGKDGITERASRSVTCMECWETFCGGTSKENAERCRIHACPGRRIARESHVSVLEPRR